MTRLNKIQSKFKRNDLFMGHKQESQDAILNSSEIKSPHFNDIKCLKPDEVKIDQKNSKQAVSDNLMLNLPIYEIPKINSYPRNPFSVDKSGTAVHYSL